ncbi:hypothetical protein C8035_v002448 [Colletotrichum spinosum]|uniref:Uncharacterized protein n=1 Tax=Colletotrichum spinosum TaxID=1347390 RepID=A0A4R8PY98_9PEZI|nr:hypothetical protein C8035_v002448 [Colletotrichum spinosum]
MDEEKHKFIIPAHERRQPVTVTTSPDQEMREVASSPLEAPRIHHIDHSSYPQTAHLQDASDTSPSYPDSGTVSTDGDQPTPIPAVRHVPTASATALGSAPEPEGRLGGWMRRLENAGQPEGRPRKTILGLTVFRFWVAVALGVTIVGVAIAVGLALGLANRPSFLSNADASSSSSLSNEPTAVLQLLGVPSPAPINPYCPQEHQTANTTVTPYDASGSPIRFNNDQAMSFDVLCNTFWPQRQGLNPSLRDILVMTVPDMLTCMTLCAQYNQGYSDAVGDDVYVGGGICVGVALIKGVGQFCYLKNSTGINDTSAAGGFAVDSAVLSGDWAGMTSIQQTLAFGGNIEMTGNATTAT